MGKRKVTTDDVQPRRSERKRCPPVASDQVIEYGWDSMTACRVFKRIKSLGSTKEECDAVISKEPTGRPVTSKKSAPHLLEKLKSKKQTKSSKKLEPPAFRPITPEKAARVVDARKEEAKRSTTNVRRPLPKTAVKAPIPAVASRRFPLTTAKKFVIQKSSISAGLVAATLLAPPPPKPTATVQVKKTAALVPVAVAEKQADVKISGKTARKPPRLLAGGTARKKVVTAKPPIPPPDPNPSSNAVVAPPVLVSAVTEKPGHFEDDPVEEPSFVYNAPDYDRMHNPDGNAANANDLIKYTRLLRNSRQDSGCIIFKPGAKKGLSTNSQCQLTLLVSRGKARIYTSEEEQVAELGERAVMCIAPGRPYDIEALPGEDLCIFFVRIWN